MFEIKAIRISQPIGEFYVGKVNSVDLYDMASADILRISEQMDINYEGIQRELNPAKIKKIVNYLSSKEATFPNSIILSTNEEFFISYADDKLKLKKDKKTFTIIDGQHRLEGLHESGLQNFEVPVSIFIGLNNHEQSNIFVTINTEQTKVDPSVSLYHSIYDNTLTPQKMAVLITENFALDRVSPWYRMIKLIGKKDKYSVDGLITLSAFANQIIDLIYNKDDLFLYRNLVIDDNEDFRQIRKGIFWEFFYNGEEGSIYKILSNYFNALKEILPNDWGNIESLLCKTTGYNAVMKLFPLIFVYADKYDDYTKDMFKKILKPLEAMDGKINTKNNISPSGAKASNDLYNMMKERLEL